MWEPLFSNIMNIPTAEEFTKKLLTEVANCRGVRVQSVVVSEAFIEFAKLHVEAALKEASEKAELSMYEFKEEWMNSLNSTEDERGNLSSIYKPSILNAYPLDNIK